MLSSLNIHEPIKAKCYGIIKTNTNKTQIKIQPHLIYTSLYQPNTNRPILLYSYLRKSQMALYIHCAHYSNRTYSLEQSLNCMIVLTCIRICQIYGLINKSYLCSNVHVLNSIDGSRDLCIICMFKMSTNNKWYHELCKDHIKKTKVSLASIH